MPATDQSDDTNESKNKPKSDLVFVRFYCLRLEGEIIADMHRRLHMLMEESTTYLGILEEGEKTGELKGERKMILKLGSLKFGPASHEILSRINAITLAEQLEPLGEKILSCSNWEELFAGS